MMKKQVSSSSSRTVQGPLMSAWQRMMSHSPLLGVIVLLSLRQLAGSWRGGHQVQQVCSCSSSTAHWGRKLHLLLLIILLHPLCLPMGNMMKKQVSSSTAQRRRPTMLHLLLLVVLLLQPYLPAGKRMKKNRTQGVSSSSVTAQWD
jgi:hypothetical protein